MSSRSMGSGMQVVKPPQRGIFPLDHMAECRNAMEEYVLCLQHNNDYHYKCQDLSKQYLQCRMDHQLMSKENLNQLGYSYQVENAREYNNEKERTGYIAGKHIASSKKTTSTSPASSSSTTSSTSESSSSS